MSSEQSWEQLEPRFRRAERYCEESNIESLLHELCEAAGIVVDDDLNLRPEPVYPRETPEQLCRVDTSFGWDNSVLRVECDEQGTIIISGREGDYEFDQGSVIPYHRWKSNPLLLAETLEATYRTYTPSLGPSTVERLSQSGGGWIMPFGRLKQEREAREQKRDSKFNKAQRYCQESNLEALLHTLCEADGMPLDKLRQARTDDQSRAKEEDLTSIVFYIHFGGSIFRVTCDEQGTISISGGSGDRERASSPEGLRPDRPYQVWKNNPQVLEEDLEIAYRCAFPS